MYNAGNCIYYPVINHSGKDYTNNSVSMYKCIYIIESPCCTAEINKTLQINYVSIKIIFFKDYLEIEEENTENSFNEGVSNT